ncbi:hypothetical protein E2C01_102823 [Portunus trituberculatus]|uniref:Uncharacterized protein n=1 Tax=Portunus trituberculatus TaxID=210409 RepID=A0A5B7KJA0_PORTR|nr:hypothetical protein [Portunus trituberculatus]
MMEVRKHNDKVQQSVKVIEEKQSVWIKQREGDEEYLKKIIEEQQKEKQEETGKGHVAEEGNQAINLVEEFHRIGKFEEQKERPLKIKFTTQVQAVVVLSGSWKLAGNDEFKNVWINKDLDEDERTRVKELVTEAKQKNDMRMEEEKEQFYGRVRDLRLRKKFIRR